MPALALPSEVLPPHTIDLRAVTGGVGNNAASRTNYMRARGMALTISKLAVNIGTSSGNICLAVYSNTGTGTAARPAALKATTGSVVCPAAGEAVVALTAPVLVQPGDWFALAADNATATFARNSVPSMTTAGLAFTCQQTSAFPCPTTPASLGPATSAFFILGVE